MHPPHPVNRNTHSAQNRQGRIGAAQIPENTGVCVCVCVCGGGGGGGGGGGVLELTGQKTQDGDKVEI